MTGPDRPVLRLAQNPDADELLSRDSFALLVGMLLDQQVPMEKAFSGPFVIATRLGTATLDAQQIAEYDPEAFAALFGQPPAVHRFPAAMAERVQRLARHVVAQYAGDAGRIWTEAESGDDLLERLTALPGFGEQKARIFVALLGKQFGIRAPGWREAAGAYGPEGIRRSVADVTGPESLAEVRAFKREQKRAAR